MHAAVDDEGRFTDVSLWQAVQNVPDPERFQSILRPSEGKKAVGFRLDLTLEWSFSCNVDWTLLPIPFLDNLCNFLSARDVMVLGATCREMRRRISTMVLAEEARKVTTCFYFWILSSLLYQVWISELERRDQGARFRLDEEKQEQIDMHTKRILNRIWRCFLTFVASLFPCGLIAQGLSGVAVFLQIRNGVSIVPFEDESLMYSIIWGVSALYGMIHRLFTD